MKRLSLKFSALLLAFSLTQVWTVTAVKAQQTAKTEASANNQSDWYYGSEEQTPSKSIAQQKAQLRAEQRMDRLASLRWYGFTPGRPTASGMPFTTMYSPAWSRPGGRPFSWYTGYPTSVYNVGYRYW